MATSVIGSHIFGTKDVTSAGTAVVLDATDYYVQAVLIQAHDNNVGRIFYGGSDVASTTQRGLAAGASVSITGNKRFKLSTFYIDAGTSDDGVDFIVTRA